MWTELVRRKWKDPLSSLRREWFELSLIKDLIIFDRSEMQSIKKSNDSLEGRTITMPTIFLLVEEDQ